MAKKIVYLEYTFLMDPADTFQHLYEFEKFLEDFLVAHGYEGNVIESVSGGNQGRRMVYINKISQSVAPSQASRAGRPPEPKGQLKNVKDATNYRLRAPALKFQGKK